MDIFEYLPQLIIAYDGRDEFANLIHVKKARKDTDYCCPCCGGIVKPRALDSAKEQSHYYHITGKCTKESQLHFFCKNWLFGAGCKFYIGSKLFEVDTINIEKTYSTQFGNYRPDVTVYTKCGKTIYFEMFFSNRKTGDDYFCRWDALGNDVVEVNIKEYMFKTEENIIPVFTYLYHDGVCYSKPYVKRDLYSNTIARIKRELTRQRVLDYKARIERLDWFWAQIQNNTSKETILKSIACMEYDDMVACYDIIKRKHCVAYLKNDVLDLINKTVVRTIREELNLPFDENVYFDLKQHHGRTYEAGIRLNIKLPHIVFDDFYLRCDFIGYDFDKISKYPKVVFKKNIFSHGEIQVPENKINELQNIFAKTVEYKKALIAFEDELRNFEGDKYKIRVHNNRYTVLIKSADGLYEMLVDNKLINTLDIKALENEIKTQIASKSAQDFLNKIKNDEHCHKMTAQFKNYKGIESRIDFVYKEYTDYRGLFVNLWLYRSLFFAKELEPREDAFIECVNECKDKLDEFIGGHKIIWELISVINDCRNGLWKAEFASARNNNFQLLIRLNCSNYKYLAGQNIYCRIELSKMDLSDKVGIIHAIEEAMRYLLQRTEDCGFRIWFEGGADHEE